MSFVIDAVDATIKRLLARDVTQLRSSTGAVTDAQIGFQPPDRDWRGIVNGLGTRRAVNVYLVDLRENRQLRSTERIVEHDAGMVFETPTPMRVDCHYLVTAWSPATEAAGRTVAEHALLSEVLSVLAAVPTLVPRVVFTPGGVPQSFPPQLEDSVMPVAILPTEGFPRLGEFWGTMLGQNHPWKPVVHLVVTVPLHAGRDFEGSEVTTVTAAYQHGDDESSRELVVQIAGVVRDGSVAPPVPIAGAWVQLQGTAGSPMASTRTNGLGEFTFVGLAPGPYQLLTRAAGHDAPAPIAITVPSPTGRYDLQFN